MPLLRAATRLAGETAPKLRAAGSQNVLTFEAEMRALAIRTRPADKPITERSGTGRIFPTRDFTSTEASGIEAAGWLLSKTAKTAKQ